MLRLANERLRAPMTPQSDMFMNLGGGLLTTAYPYETGSKDSDTGKQAGDNIEHTGKADKLRNIILSFMANYPDGLTADECAALIQEDILNVRPRFSELRLQGILKDAGVRRLSKNGNPMKVFKMGYNSTDGI